MKELIRSYNYPTRKGKCECLQTQHKRRCNADFNSSCPHTVPGKNGNKVWLNIMYSRLSVCFLVLLSGLLGAGILAQFQVYLGFAIF